MLTRTAAADLAHVLVEQSEGRRGSVAARDSDLRDLVLIAQNGDEIPQDAAELARARLERRAADGRQSAADALAELDREPVA